MRALGDVSQAVLTAARELFTPHRAPTLAELQQRACVSTRAARATIQNLTRSGHLKIVREREVDYRNRPVCEYAPAEAPTPADDALSRVMSHWTNR